MRFKGNKKEQPETKDKGLIEIEKKIAQRNKIKAAFNEMDKFIEECDVKIEELVAKARKAKDNAGLKLLKSSIASVMAAKSRAEKMRFSMDAIMTMNEVAKMTSGFLGNMEVLCKELNDVSKNNLFGKLDKSMSEAMRNYEMQSDRLENLFENLTDTFDDVEVNLDSATEDLVDKLIEGSSLSNETEAEASMSIEARLEKLKKA